MKRITGSEIFQVFRSFTRFTTKVFASLLIIAGSLSQITTPANAETDVPINFLSLSVCADKYLTRQIAICVPKGQNYVAQLSVKDINKGLTQNVLSDGKVIVPSTSEIISLSELPVASYEWQLLRVSTSQTPMVIKNVKFKIVDLSVQAQTARGIMPTPDSTFVESYVLLYEDKSLESLLTSEFGISSSNFEQETFAPSATSKKIISKIGPKLIEIGLTQDQFNFKR